MPKHTCLKFFTSLGPTTACLQELFCLALFKPLRLSLNQIKLFDDQSSQQLVLGASETLKISLKILAFLNLVISTCKILETVQSNKPRRDRSRMTQPARHNHKLPELNILDSFPKRRFQRQCSQCYKFHLI